MTKRSAISMLAQDLAATLAAVDRHQTILLLTPADGESLSLTVGLLVTQGDSARSGPVVFLLRDVDGMSAEHRRRASEAFGRLGRSPQPVGNQGRPQWFLNLGGDAGIAAEAAVGLFRDVYAPLENDYHLRVRRLPADGGVVRELPDNGRRSAPTPR